MNYLGDYLNNYIYGTLNNHSIRVATVDDAVYLKCDLTLTLGSDTWNHTFKVPFFNDNAELNIEPYVHSFLTQKFSIGAYNPAAINVFGFNFCSVSITIEEWDNTSMLDSISRSFKMILGKFDELNSSVLSSQKIQLNAIQSKYHSSKGTLTFSLISPVSPEAVIVTTATGAVEETITSAAYAYPYTLTVPLSLFINENTETFSVEVRFPDESTMNLGEFFVMDNVTDHTLVAYQNEFGTLSFLEFSGERTDSQDFNSSLQELNINNSNRLRENSFTESLPIELNTGFIYDQEKHQALRKLITSYNKFILMNDLLKYLVNDGSNKLQPYKTDTYIKNESLKFKLATNDNPALRIF